MEPEFNPYASPQTPLPLRAELIDADKPAVWRDGRLIVIPHGAGVPARCWRCNSSDIAAQIQCKLSWFPPGYLLLFLLGPVPFLIVVLLVQWKAKFVVSLCPEHLRRRRRHTFITWAIALSAVALILVAGSNAIRNPWRTLAVATGCLLFILAIVYGGVTTTLVRARRIDKHAALVTGAGTPFLDSLP